MAPDSRNGRSSRPPSDKLNEAALASRIRSALAGHDPGAADDASGDGATRPTSGAPSTGAVIWEDAGDEVLVYLASVRVKMAGQTIVVSVDLETDQTGRAPVIVRFVFGTADDGAGMIAATDELPHGDAVLAARWGTVLRDVVWCALVGTATAYARARGLAPQAIHVQNGQLRLRATVDVPLAERLELHAPGPPKPPGRLGKRPSKIEKPPRSRRKGKPKRRY